MGFLSSRQQNTSTSPLVDKSLDPDKHAVIVKKLCEKRHTLESAISKLHSPEKEEVEKSLSELRGAMSVFGISEVEYQAHISKPHTQFKDNTPTSMPAAQIELDMNHD